MLQTQRYGSQVSRSKITDKQTNKQTDYYTRGRPRAPRVTMITPRHYTLRLASYNYTLTYM